MGLEISIIEERIAVPSEHRIRDKTFFQSYLAALR